MDPTYVQDYTLSFGFQHKTRNMIYLALLLSFLDGSGRQMTSTAFSGRKADPVRKLVLINLDIVIQIFPRKFFRQIAEIIHF
jgi:hypothetical protein